MLAVWHVPPLVTLGQANTNQTAGIEGWVTMHTDPILSTVVVQPEGINRRCLPKVCVRCVHASSSTVTERVLCVCAPPPTAVCKVAEERP